MIGVDDRGRRPGGGARVGGRARRRLGDLLRAASVTGVPARARTGASCTPQHRSGQGCTSRCGCPPRARPQHRCQCGSTATAGSRAPTWTAPPSTMRGRPAVGWSPVSSTDWRPRTEPRGTPRAQVACAHGRLADGVRDLGGDPLGMVLAGGSAGGQLAVSVVHRAATGTQASSCGRPAPAPRAAAALYPALDSVDGIEHGGRSPVPGLDARYGKTVHAGKTPTEVPDGTGRSPASTPPARARRRR